MMNTLEAVVKNGQIVLTEPVALPEGSRALVTLIETDEAEFWLSAAEESLNDFWDNSEDDVYAELPSK